MMRVTAEVPNTQQSDEFLAIVAVSSDNPKVVTYEAPINNVPQQICRTIVGTISEKGRIWADYFDFYKLSIRPTEQGTKYCVHPLQIDYDVYTFPADIICNDEEITIIVYETFLEDINEYKGSVHSRNLKVKEYLRKLDTGQFTRGEISQLLGGNPKGGPDYDQMIPAAEYLKCKKQVMQEAIKKGYTKNIRH